ncbi:MAG TPA: trehalose-phosphatase [Herbaspirillum sp.]
MPSIPCDYDPASDALFLDFDGTLVDLAARPEDVIVPPQLIETLWKLQSLSQGALAIISGRPLAQIDHFLQPLQLPAAGTHGMERRSADGKLTQLPAPDTARLLARLKPLVDDNPGLLLELKQGAVALHYRHAPQLEQTCVQAITAALALESGFTLLRGKMVLEAMTSGVDKGQAIAGFMAESPFSGRRPVFAGDDVTDESGFSWVQSEQGKGLGIKVGAGPSVARARSTSPADLHAVLFRILSAEKG